MLSEWLRAILQASASHSSAGKPFCTRTWFVCSNARCSILPASAKLGETLAVEVVAGVKRVTSLATDADLASCARSTEQQNRSPTRARRHVRSARVMAGVRKPQSQSNKRAKLGSTGFCRGGLFWSGFGGGLGEEGDGLRPR